MASALRDARRGAVFGVLAALLLANPLYVGMLVDQPRSRSPTGYHAQAVDPANASDQQALLVHLGDEAVVDVEALANAREYNPYGHRYRAPAKAAALLREARNGSVRTTDEDVAFTLRRLGASRRFVSVPDGEDDHYFELDVGEANGSTVVGLDPVDRATVARHVFYANARLYGSLPGYQRDTVDDVVAAEGSYRPYNDEFVHLTDDVVVRNGTAYLFTARVHVDDFGPSTQALVSAALSLLGVLSLLVALVATSRSLRADEP